MFAKKTVPYSFLFFSFGASGTRSSQPLHHWSSKYRITKPFFFFVVSNIVDGLLKLCEGITEQGLDLMDHCWWRLKVWLVAAMHNLRGDGTKMRVPSALVAWLAESMSVDALVGEAIRRVGCLLLSTLTLISRR